MMRASMFVGAHVLLALAIRAAPWLATVHAVASLFVGVVIAASTKTLGRIAAVVAYIAGAEVLWRMTKAAVFWEYGKYAVCAVVFVGLLRIQGRRNRNLAVAYLALLLPSALLTLFTVGLDDARQQISFNLSGPLTIALCALFFSNVRLTQDDLRRVFIAGIGPIVAIAARSLFSTIRFESVVQFSNQSNYLTTAGFGPNQVSAALGLGVLFAMLLLLDRGLPFRARVPLLALGVVLAIQSALTFSRGGLLAAGIALVVAMLYLIQDRRSRLSIVVVAILLFGIGIFVVEPRLEKFTGGAISQRFSNTGSTGRDQFALMDFKIFASHPLMGVGPGMADSIREQIGGHVVTSHTEYTRMLAEHGILGVAALIILVILAVRGVRETGDVRARAFVAAMFVWMGLFLAIYAMRLAAPAVVFGLGCAISYSSRKLKR